MVGNGISISLYFFVQHNKIWRKLNNYNNALITKSHNKISI